jgi:hypothetical protein
MRTVLQCLGVSIASVLGTVLLLLVYAVVADAVRPTRRVSVAFSDFLVDVDTGRVASVEIRGQVYTYERRDGEGRTSTRETIGPRIDVAELRTLRPSDPSLPPPTIDAR